MRVLSDFGSNYPYDPIRNLTFSNEERPDITLYIGGGVESVEDNSGINVLLALEYPNEVYQCTHTQEIINARIIKRENNFFSWSS